MPLNSADSILSQGLAVLQKSDVDIERLTSPRREEITALLENYISQIELYNPTHGLVGTSDRRELIIRHILDSLSPLGIIYRLLAERKMSANEWCIAYIGSGAGLPGIPLAIALPNVQVTLIERMGKRAGFLRNAQATLALKNILIKEAQMEEVVSAGQTQFPLLTFRAFKPLEPKLLKKLFRLCTPDGALAAYKGRREKIEAEMFPLKAKALCGKWEAIPCPTPFLEEERHLLVIHPAFLP